MLEGFLRRCIELLGLMLGGGLLATFVWVADRGGKFVQRLSPKVVYRISKGDAPALRLRSRVRQITARLKSAPSANLDELFELHDMLIVFERLLASGASVLVCFEWLGARSTSPIARRFGAMHRRICSGSPLISELRDWQVAAGNRETQDMAAKLIAATQTGADIVAVLRSLRESLSAAARAKQIANLGSSETRIMIPLVFLVLPITVLFAVFPSLSLLNLTLQ